MRILVVVYLFSFAFNAFIYTLVCRRQGAWDGKSKIKGYVLHDATLSNAHANSIRRRRQGKQIDATGRRKPGAWV
uniref:Putative secreted protein n=1 Tax=Anopheles darlingi TaxID=43151 RepID=A0A2M4DPX9_ANODA